MENNITLVDTISELLLMKEDWLNKPVVQRRNIIREYHKRVEELSVEEPYDTDDGMIHHFGDGTYGREANVKKGVALVGAVYGEPQINVLLQGKVFVMTENVVDIMEAPCIFTSDANTNKVGYVIEDMQWLTVMNRKNYMTDPEMILKQHTLEGG